MIVIDASVLVDVVLRDEAGVAAASRFQTRDHSMHAPYVIDLEVTNVLRHLAATGQIADTRGHEALADLVDIPIERYPHRPLLERVWELRHDVTAYDAAYLALAEALHAPLVTRDPRLASIAGHDVTVELI